MDKIQHAYGWTDEVVLDLTLRRVVQIKESIEQREEFNKYENSMIAEWQTTRLANIVAMGIQTDKEGLKVVNQALDDMHLIPRIPNRSGGVDTKTGEVISNRKRILKTKDGKEITRQELKNYTYEEIDHSEHEQQVKDKVRQQNKGIDITRALAGF